MRKYARLRYFVRNQLPDVPFVRKLISDKMEKAVLATLIPEEDVRYGEESLHNKETILSKYQGKLGAFLSKTEDELEEAVKTCVRYQSLSADELDAIRTDMRFCRIAYGFLPGEYAAFSLERRGMEERKSYVSDQQRRIYRYKMNDILAANIFIDKSKTYAKYKKYFHRNVIAIRIPQDFGRFHQFVSTHEEFVLKNALDSLGKGVSLVKRAEMGDERAFFNACIHKGIHVLEERIRQSNALSAFNETSVNTVRVITVKTKKGIVVPYCILRMGRKGAFVDNSGNGGLIACIDYATGKLKTDGYDEKGLICPAHPDTGTVFKGAQLPEWDKLQALSEEAANQSEKINFVGWDFAHTENGWVMVEGNDSPHIIAQQMILGGLQQTMKQLLKEMEV